MPAKPTTGQTALLWFAVAAALAVAVFIPPPATSTLPREVLPEPRPAEAAVEPPPEKAPDIAVPRTFGFRGVVLYNGPRPELAPVVPQGAKVRDAEVCAAQPIPDESLVVNPYSLGIRNVFVYLSPTQAKPDAPRPAEAEVLCRVERCRFVPRAMLVRAGQTVVVKSDEPITHSTHTFPLRNTPPGVPVVRDGVLSRIALPHRENMPFQVKCDFHSWMSAFWLVLDHPYAAITDEDGHFQIDGLPPGEYSFAVWHEKAGYLERKLQVQVGEKEEPAVLKYAPEKFLK